MSAREAWQSALADAFGGAARVLWVGDKRLAPANALLARDLDALPATQETFEGIGLITRADVRASLALLRPRLAPGGSLLLVLDASLLLGAVTRAFRFAPKAEVTPLIEASEALLLLGFEEPRVVTALRPRLVLTAKKPQRLGALDAFFEQPTP
jgi:hypothetical protein